MAYLNNIVKMQEEVSRKLTFFFDVKYSRRSRKAALMYDSPDEAEFQEIKETLSAIEQESLLLLDSFAGENNLFPPKSPLT